MFNPNQSLTFQGQQQTPSSQKNSEIQPQQIASNQQSIVGRGQQTFNPVQSQLGQPTPSNPQSILNPNPQVPKISQITPNSHNFPNPQIQQVVQNQNSQSIFLIQPPQQAAQVKSSIIPPFQIQNQLPPPIQQLPQVDFIQAQVVQNLELKAKKEQLEQLGKKSEDLVKQLDEYNQKFNSFNQQKQKQLVLIQEIRKEIEKEETKKKELTKQLNNQQKELNSQLQEITNQFNEIQMERNELQTQLGMEVQKINQLTQEFRESKRNTNTDQNKKMQAKIEQLMNENRKLKEDLELQIINININLLQLNNQNKEHEVIRLQDIIDSKTKYLSQIQSETSQIKVEIGQLEAHIQQRDQSINQISFDVKQEERKLKTLVQQVDSMKQEMKLSEDRIRLKSEQISQLEIKTLSNLKISANGQQLSKLKQEIENQTLSYDQEIMKKQGSITQSKMSMAKNKNEQKLFEESQKNLRIKQGKELQIKYRENFGQLEVCFLIDSTASMEPYKKQAQLCVKGSLKAIKDLTQRDTNWSTVCYVDTDILKRLGGMYQQFGFTNDSDELERFIQSVKCTANRDLPEDVEGGMQQMLNNIPWYSSCTNILIEGIYKNMIKMGISIIFILINK